MNSEWVPRLIVGVTCTGLMSAFGYGLIVQENVAYGFAREGFSPACDNEGDLAEAQDEPGPCNPWNDTDSNMEFTPTGETTPIASATSSIHYNATMALALVAGFKPCAAFGLAMYDEVTDQGVPVSYTFKAPWPYGLSKSDCDGTGGGFDLGDYGFTLYTSHAEVTSNYSFIVKDNDDIGVTAEQRRQALSFHYNQTFDFNNVSTDCSANGTLQPVPPNNINKDGKDVLTADDLWTWASQTSSPAEPNQCSWTGLDGPLQHFNPTSDEVTNGIGAFGHYLHALQDFHSHSPWLVDDGSDWHAWNEDTTDHAGSASSHFAGEFGTFGADQLPASTPVEIAVDTVLTEATGTPYPIMLHSNTTVTALTETYTKMKLWLVSHADEKQRTPICTDAKVLIFARNIAKIPNYSRNETASPTPQPSGAKRRSDMADGVWAHIMDAYNSSSTPTCPSSL